MIDLHTHSNCSDGSESPEAVVELAAAAGCSALALTDHDTLSGLEAAKRRADALGIEFVPGCEVSCATANGTEHVLCYFVGPGSGPLVLLLERLRAEREHRNLEMVERLRGLGLPLTLEEVLAEAGGTGIGRPHFAAVLVRNGAASSIQEAFDRYLAKGRPGYIPKATVDISEVIERSRSCGALAVLAHPLSLGLEPSALEHELVRLRKLGLAGIECYYGAYEPPTRARLVQLARRHDLVATGGSDFHGAYKPGLEVCRGTGDLEVPDAVLEALHARRVSRDWQP